jgi:hypothetical protein
VVLECYVSIWWFLVISQLVHMNPQLLQSDIAYGHMFIHEQNATHLDYFPYLHWLGY